VGATCIVIHRKQQAAGLPWARIVEKGVSLSYSIVA
jgi:hypothetical protein